MAKRRGASHHPSRQVRAGAGAKTPSQHDQPRGKNAMRRIPLSYYGRDTDEAQQQQQCGAADDGTGMECTVSLRNWSKSMRASSA